MAFNFHKRLYGLREEIHMQWLMLIMVVYANGGTKMESPTVFYSKKACVNAQEVIQNMTPRNATATFITSCVSRGGRGND